MSELRDVLMKRDGLTFDEATEQVKEARERVMKGENPEEILLDEFGLETDYIMDLL
jgi:hypothetical protein